MRTDPLMFEGTQIAARYPTGDRPWLDAQALCALLGYGDWQRALLEHCHPAEILFGDGEIPQAFISLSSLQRLSARAPGPRAQRLHQWSRALAQR